MKLMPNFRFQSSNQALKSLIASIFTAAICSSMLIGCSKGIKPEVQKPTPLVTLSKSINLLEPVLRIHIAEGRYKHSNKDVLELHPAFDGTNMIAASTSGKVSRYDANGKQIWSVDIDDVITGGVTWDKTTATAIITTRSANVMALDSETGQLRWKQQLNSSILAPALIGDNRVLLSGNDGVLHGLSLQTGKPVWQYSTKMPSISIRGNATPSLYRNNTAFFATADGRIHAINVRTGILSWSRRIGVAVGISEIERINDIDAMPVVKDDQLYAISYSGQLQGINLNNRQVTFSQNAASLNQLVITEQLVIATTLDGSVIAFDRLNGAKVWQNDALKHRHLSNPVMAGYHIAVGDYAGVVHLLNQSTGEIVSRYNAKDSIQHLQVVDNKLLAQNQDGNVFVWRW